MAVRRLMSTEQERLSQDLVFDVLSSPRRRYVLYYLRQHGDEVELGTLSAEVAAWENEKPVEELTDQERKRVYVSLYQTHIPKLSDAGIVEYDQESGTVSLTGRAEEIDRYLRAGEGDLFPWQLYYLAIAVVGAALLAGVNWNVWILAGTSPALVGLAVVVVFGVSAAVQYYYWRRRRDEIPSELMDDRT